MGAGGGGRRDRGGGDDLPADAVRLRAVLRALPRRADRQPDRDRPEPADGPCRSGPGRNRQELTPRLFRQDPLLICQDLFLVPFDPCLVAQYLIELALVGQNHALVALDLPLVLDDLIELLLIAEEPGLIAQDPRLVSQQLTFAHDASCSVEPLCSRSRWISAGVASSFGAAATRSAASTGYQSRRRRSSSPARSKGSIAR